ncbi:MULTISPECIES: hypothetical protein [unclassified Paenibacillus]|uniref:hypothetical protein n=1 Tax=unclassified Paenibacillus TaxID=185978 RepID=UPI002406494E|nr:MULTISPECIES: hypothetical protein [unclassified Paenibacillus]MDF9842076.1 hypothetical protein [Paenibacillus sp. PastF-2]MDF9848670.1 hypothetical protein [Paenibacillus sp. PastM-2]MDF9855239.1 hypothetical protein [Paenibacillus sp. PastF-1]MDH6480510.1 hypothetical protein [Paenibacillus sp. PastH-2]MDH6507937.1 hypothetical protein [Paenibacillus sp. PastM-3]
MEKMLLVCIMIMVMLASAYGNMEMTLNPNVSDEPKSALDESVIPNNRSEYCEMESINLDSEAEKYVYGTWKVEKHLGFANSYNDASEYPTGQKFIGDEMIINKAFFSSKGLKNYSVYQYELKNPVYEITATCYNSDSFYRLYKIDLPGLNINDAVKVINISDPSTKLSIPLSFFVVNNDRLILLAEATIFELNKLTDETKPQPDN